MKITPLQALIPKNDVVTDATSFFKSLKESFDTDFKEAHFDLYPSNYYFIYLIESKKIRSIGLVCQIDRKTILDNKILKHEQIIKGKSELLKGFIKQSGAMTKPIMTFHQNDGFLIEVYEKLISQNDPEFSIQIEEETHSIFKVSDADVIQQIEKRFDTNIPDAFIADGHHRFDSMQKILAEEENIEGIVVVLFGANQIKVEAYNKLIQEVSFQKSEHVIYQLKKLGHLTRISQMAFPDHPHEITILIQGQSYLLQFDKEVLSKHLGAKHLTIDLEIISTEIFSSILGLSMDDKKIIHLNKNETLDFIKSSNGEGNCLFCFYPLDILDIIKVSRLGLVLPPKSTWFEPKVRSGIIVGNFHE